TLGHHAFSQLVIEMHPSVLELFLEVHVAESAADLAVHLGERQIVGAHEAYGSAIQESADDASGAGKPILRVCSLQQFVQQKQQRQLARGQVDELAEPCDFRIKPRTSILQRVIDPNAGSDL